MDRSDKRERIERAIARFQCLVDYTSAEQDMYEDVYGTADMTDEEREQTYQQLETVIQDYGLVIELLHEWLAESNTRPLTVKELREGRVSNDPVLIAVKCEPAADVAEVVHGEWLNFVGDYVTAECSVCGECYDPSDYNDKEHFDMFKQLYKFCPSCGAKMDGEKEGV